MNTRGAEAPAGAAGAVARAIAVAVLVVLVSGCWPQVGFGPEHRRFNDLESTLVRANVGSLTEAWSVALDASGEPIASGGRLYVRTDSASVRALDQRTGTTLWERLFGGVGSVTVSDPALSGDELWVNRVEVAGRPVPFCTGALARLDPATGETVASEDAAYRSPPVTAGPTVAYFETAVTPCTGGGPATRILRVRDSAGLATRWTYAFPAGTGSGDGHPTVAGGRIYAVVGNTLYGFDEACPSPCSPRWTLPVAPEGTALGQTPVAGEDGQVFVRTAGGETLSVDGATGAVLWRGAGVGPTALAGDTLYVGAGGEVRAFDARGCQATACGPTWTATLPSVAAVADVVVAGGVVYVAGDDGAVHALDASGCGASPCEPVVSLPTGHGAAQRLAVSDGALYAAIRETAEHPGAVVAYRPAEPAAGRG